METGSGMGASLTVASEKGAYILTDRVPPVTSRAPVLASHSCAKAVAPIVRNMPDETIRAVAADAIGQLILLLMRGQRFMP